MTVGDGLAVVAILAWLSIAVGPWWLGPVILAGAELLNAYLRRRRSLRGERTQCTRTPDA